MLNSRNYVRASLVSVLSASLFAAGACAASAAAAPTTSVDAVSPAVEAPASAVDLAPTPVTVTFVYNGEASNFATEAKTFGDLLTERGIHAAEGDYLSADTDTKLVDGMHVEYRAAVPISIVLGRHTIWLRTSAATIDGAIAAARIAMGPRDLVSPARTNAPRAGIVVHVTRINEWVERVDHEIKQNTIHRSNAALPLGKTRVVAQGIPGIRELTIRFTRRGEGATRSKLLSSRIVRHARPEIVENGTYVAGTGSKIVSSAMHFAGSVLHVIATAYIAGCYKCSGITANGMHAGFGIIAVDPHLIPLGSKLMIPGYGRAIAGDTGGAIVGNRIDLGMDHLADAIRFGRRPMTVYVLK